MNVQHLPHTFFSGERAIIDITDPRSGEVITCSGELVTDKESEWLMMLVEMDESSMRDIQDALERPW